MAESQYSAQSVANQMIRGQLHSKPNHPKKAVGATPSRYDAAELMRNYSWGSFRMRHANSINRATCSNIMSSIESKVLVHCRSVVNDDGHRDSSVSGSPGNHSLCISMDLNIEEFLSSQFPDTIPCLGSVLALTGSISNAQATTCKAYLEKIWPRIGCSFLNMLQSVFQNPVKARNVPKTSKVSHGDSDLSIKLYNYMPAKFLIRVQGNLDLVIEFVQQLTWIGAVMQVPPKNSEMTYCDPVIESGPPRSGNINLSYKYECVSETGGHCWLFLFPGSSIARGFPVTGRQTGVGLEIPLGILAQIAGIRHAVEYEGGVVMKGFSSILVPIKRVGNIIQWHLIRSSNPQARLSYRDALKLCQSRALLEDVDLDCLNRTRAIVGWCGVSSSLLGSQETIYENLDYSGAKDATTPLKISGGSLGFQQFGAAQLDFTLGVHTGKCHFGRHGPYQRVIAAAEKTPILLYDTSEKRAWLLPATEVILHVAQHRHHLDPYVKDGDRAQLPVANSPEKSAKEVLQQHASMEILHSEKYTFGDLVLDIWSILEFLLDQKTQTDQNPGYAVNKMWEQALRGYEFKAVVEERSPFKQKQTTIQKTSGGWPALINDIDALVLFASGFGDLIQPTAWHPSNQGLCARWRTLPSDKDYLATTVSTLKDLYNVAGCRLDQKYLTSTHLQWDRGGSKLFEPCSNPQNYMCDCVRLQQVRSKSTIGSIVPPGVLADGGAVIFGSCTGSRQQRSSLRGGKVVQSLYSQPNVTLLGSEATLCERGTSATTKDLTRASLYSGQVDQPSSSGKHFTATSLALRGTTRVLDAQPNADSEDASRRSGTAPLSKNTCMSDVVHNTVPLNQGDRCLITFMTEPWAGKKADAAGGRWISRREAA